MNHRIHLWDLGAMTARNAHRFPDKPAYIEGDRVLSWSEVDRLSRRLANGLLSQGVHPGDHVALLGENCLEWAVCQHATWKIGAVPVFLHGMLGDDALVKQLRQADIRVLLIGPAFVSRSKVLEEQSKVEVVVTWSRDASSSLSSVSDLLDWSSEDELKLAVEPTDTSMITYSSGTTGTPKGAINTFETTQAKTNCAIATEELTHRENGLICGPLYMGGTQILSFIPYAMLGMTCVLLDGFDAKRVLAAIDRHRVNVFFAVPTMLRELSLAYGGSTEVASLTRVFSSGAPLPPELYARWRETLGVPLYEMAGSSETGGGLAISQQERDEGKSNSVGRPMIGYRVRVTDSDGNELPPMKRGELSFLGDAVADGYYNQPSAEQEAFRDGWFFTGDIGYCDNDGYYYMVDRAKDMIISGGVNVFPREVEDAIDEMDGVQECAVIGLSDDKWGEAVHAVIVRTRASRLSQEDVVEHCRNRLAAFQVPKSIDFVEEIPRTPVGKVSKRSLRDRYSHG